MSHGLLFRRRTSSFFATRAWHRAARRVLLSTKALGFLQRTWHFPCTFSLPRSGLEENADPAFSLSTTSDAP